MKTIFLVLILLSCNAFADTVTVQVQPHRIAQHTISIENVPDAACSKKTTRTHVFSISWYEGRLVRNSKYYCQNYDQCLAISRIVSEAKSLGTDLVLFNSSNETNTEMQGIRRENTKAEKFAQEERLRKKLEEEKAAELQQQKEREAAAYNKLVTEVKEYARNFSICEKDGEDLFHKNLALAVDLLDRTKNFPELRRQIGAPVLIVKSDLLFENKKSKIFIDKNNGKKAFSLFFTAESSELPDADRGGKILIKKDTKIYFSKITRFDRGYDFPATDFELKIPGSDLNLNLFIKEGSYVNFPAPIHNVLRIFYELLNQGLELHVVSPPERCNPAPKIVPKY